MMRRSLWQDMKMDIIAKRKAYSSKKLIACLLTDIEFQTMLSYRVRHRLIKYGVPGRTAEKILWLLTVWYTSCHIRAEAEIEGGVDIIHANGIFIGGGVTIKTGTRILQQVTLGVKDFSEKNLAQEGYPTIESGAIIFAGAKVLGNIRIGENAVVGANAVVVKDVPDYMVAVGIPAINRKKRN